METLSRIPIGQYIARESFVHRLDPRVKIILLLICLFLIFISNNLWSYLLAGAFIGVCFLGAQISVIYMVRALKPIWIILLITLIFHLWLNKEGELLLEWGWIRVYEQGLVQGVTITLRILFLILLSSLLTLSTKPLVLTDGLERLLSPLKRFKFPAHELALMVSIALRFIPTFLQEMEKIIKAQSARGAQFQGGGLGKKAAAFMSILIPLFLSSFQRAEDLALAMEARAYRGGEGRTQYRQLVMGKGDLVAILIVLVFALIFLLVRA